MLSLTHSCPYLFWSSTQEVCNPQVRPHLHFYPEDTGKKLGEGRQVERWLKKLRPEETTPMVCIHRDDYYIYEPALLKDLSMCILECWFTQDGTFFARAWKMEIRVIEGQLGWVVRKDIELEVSEHQFAKGFVMLEKEFEQYQLPHPSLIHGMRIFITQNTSLNYWNRVFSEGRHYPSHRCYILIWKVDTCPWAWYMHSGNCPPPKFQSLALCSRRCQGRVGCVCRSG